MNKNKSLLLVTVITFGIILLLYKDIVFHLNNFLFTAQGDGTKNYFNFLYHIKWDSNYFNFEGMNYPYNEFLLMVDCHPLIANLLKFISNNVVDISPYSVGILNALMLFSLIITAIFLFLILDHYKFKWYNSIGGAIAISFLSSNSLLWNYGHYALSYSCFFPIAWYLLLKYKNSNNKTKFSILILANTLFWFYTHNYLGFIILGFTFAYHLFTYLIQKTKINILAFSLQVIIPTVFVYLAISLFDNHAGRIVMPYITDYRASFQTVFLPNNSFLRPLYDLFFDLTIQDSQKWSRIGNYIGLSTNLIILGTLGYIFYKLLVKKRWIAGSILNKSEWVILVSAIALLLFSMSIPFRFNLEILLPPIMKQFVAIGRFAWAFYFVIIVVSFKLLKRICNKKTAQLLILLSSLLLSAEGISYHLYLKKEISENTNIFHYSDAGIKLPEIDYSRFQAIVPIPFYHKYISLHSYKSTTKSEQLSMKLSYKTGLPLMSAILSRPSVIESKQILQIFAPAFFKKPVINNLNSKPLLLMYSKDIHTKEEKELLDKAELIHENEKYGLYKLPVDSICTSNRNLATEFQTKQNLFLTDENSTYYKLFDHIIIYNSFDEKTNSLTYRGKGSLALKKDKLNIIYKSEPETFKPDTVYNLSFWYYNNLYDQSFNSFWLEIKNKEGKVNYSRFVDPAASNIYDGNWAFNEIDFTLPDSLSTITFVTKGSNFYSDSIYFDELLIKPKYSDIYKPVTEMGNTVAIIKNNFSIPHKENIYEQNTGNK